MFMASAASAAEAHPPPLRMLGMTFSHHTVVWCALVALAVWFCTWLAARGFSKERPGKAQVVLEVLLNAFLDLLASSIGKNRGPQFLSAILALFLFLWTGNMLGLIPVPQMTFGGESFDDYDGNGVYSAGEPFVDANGDGVHNPGFTIPAAVELPTNLNVPLALALLFISFIGQGYAIKYHGVGGYLLSYFSPGGVVGVIMMPMNVISKIAEHVSISFRLFGNLYGGAVIFSVVAGLLCYFAFPIPMLAYFGVFAGTVQAFVFTMLSLTYISLEIAEDAGEGAKEAAAGGESA